MYGKKAGTLRQEQTRLQHELQDLNGRIEKARKDGTEETHPWPNGFAVTITNLLQAVF